MTLLLVSSSLDPAGHTIRRAIQDLIHPSGDGSFSWNGRDYLLAEVSPRLIYLKPADLPTEANGVEGIIFLSRHQSQRPVPVLTVHVPGNFASADLGGDAMTFPPALTGRMHAILRELRKNAPAGYAVSYEVTHHGPTFPAVPCCFVEIGSTEKEWTDDTAGRAVALSVISARNPPCVPLIGLGGTHYARRQTEMALSTRAAFGHIAPGRDLNALDTVSIRAMAKASGAVAAYIDTKALPGVVLRRIRSQVLGAGLPIVSEGEIREMGHLSWEEFQELAHLAAAHGPGLSVHAGGLPPGASPVIIRIDPPELIVEAWKVDRGALMKGVAMVPAAWVSGPGNPLLPIFLCDNEAAVAVVHALIRLCVTLLLNAQDTRVEGDDILIRRRRIDPEKVRELGIPAGPFLSALASGETIHEGGRVITPDMVHHDRLLRIHVPGLMSYL